MGGLPSRDRSVELAELIGCFIEYAGEKGRDSFPPLLADRSQPWHDFLLKLGGLKSEFPVLNFVGSQDPFDFEHAPFPRIQDWGGVVFNLLNQQIIETSKGGRREYLIEISRRPKVVRLRKYSPKLLERMLEIASITKGFFD